MWKRVPKYNEASSEQRNVVYFGLKNKNVIIRVSVGIHVGEY